MPLGKAKEVNGLGTYLPVIKAQGRGPRKKRPRKATAQLRAQGPNCLPGGGGCVEGVGQSKFLIKIIGSGRVRSEEKEA